MVKADVQGSSEAIVQALEKISTEEVRVLILHSGVGAITESDVILAEASNASIIGFNVRALPHARDAAKRDGIDMKYYSIIYELIDDIDCLARCVRTNKPPYKLKPRDKKYIYEKQKLK